MAIGKRIVERLEALGWSRTDLLCRVPDLTAQALSNLIRRDSVRSEWDERISDALGVSVTWLVYGKTTDVARQEPSNYSVVKLPIKSKRGANIDRILSNLSKTSDDGLLVAIGKIEEVAARYPIEMKKTGL